MKNVIFALCDGHGEGSPKGSPERGVGIGITEWIFNRDLVDRVLVALARVGVEAVNLTPGNENVSLRERVARLARLQRENPKKKIVFVSVHANASGQPGWSSAQGSVFFVPKGDAKSKRMALRMQKVYNKIVGCKSRGVKEANFSVIKGAYNLGINSTLVEADFFTNEKIAAEMATDEGKDKYAIALATAIATENMGVLEMLKNAVCSLLNRSV